MTIRKKTYTIYPSQEVIDADLAYVIVLRVSVEGKGFNQVIAAPGNREYRYTAGMGKIDFSMSGLISMSGSVDIPVKVIVIFKI